MTEPASKFDHSPAVSEFSTEITAPQAVSTARPSTGSSISPTHLEALDRMGFVRLPDFFDVERQLAPIIYDITRAGEKFTRDFEFRTFKAIQALNKQKLSALEKLLGYLPSLTRLAASDTMLHLSRSIGLQFPMVRRQNDVRMELPDAAAAPGTWCQDTTHHLGSKNAITFWIPLTEATVEAGSLEVIPGSHRSGVIPFHFTGKAAPDAGTSLTSRETALDEEPGENGITIEAKPGDLMIYSQFLVHRQVPNRADHMHWSFQSRHADGFDKDFIDAGYPCGDETNIFHTKLHGTFKHK
tara:strand:+ start:4832 stop:5725 length:894 start_codon:yes stop_codon:yes gene_type:complete